MPRLKDNSDIPSAKGPADVALALFTSQWQLSLAGLAQNTKIAVAYSGGADSTALLLAAITQWPGQVVALHVHHGLQQAANTFEQHCIDQCKAWQVPLTISHVDARHALGQSPEDAARTYRYKALAEMALELKAECVLLAQHADDQVETLLLALSRGAGIPGLASMPAMFERHGVHFTRPLLSVGADELRSWLKTQGINWVEDPTNQDRQFVRNRIRLDVLPAIASAFLQYRQTFIRSAAHAAQAQQLLEEFASEDLRAVGNPPMIKELQKLSCARQGNVLRYWLKKCYNTSASSRQLDELLKQIQHCQTRGHHIHLKIGAGHITRKNNSLSFEAPV